MKTGMLALALGLLTLRWLPALPPGAVLLAMLVLALMLLPFRSYPLAFFLVGLSWACFSAQRALDDRLQPALDGQTRWVEGRVVGLPQQTGTGVRFELADGRLRKGRLPKRIRVSWHGGPVVNSGERWRLALTLKRPAGLLNFHGVDHEAWLLAQRIGATATVKDGERLAPARNAWRDAVRQRLMEVDAQGREAGLAALVLGDGSGLAPEDWQVLQDTGTVHLLVISGQHIGLLAGLIYGLVAVLARYGCWPRTWPWLPWACGLAFGAALGYGLLAGFGVPVQRACVMVGLVLLWRLRFRHLGLWWPLLLALNGVLVLEPLASLQVGFWLSFAAVAVLLLAFGGRLGPWSVWQAWTRPQWLIAIGLFPVLLVLGLPISLSAPVANLFAVPWISLVVLPLALLGTALLWVPLAGVGVLWLAGGALDGLFKGLALAGRAIAGLGATRGAAGVLAGQPDGHGDVTAAQRGAVPSAGLAHVVDGRFPAQGVGAPRTGRGAATGCRPGAGTDPAYPPPHVALRCRAALGACRPRGACRVAVVEKTRGRAVGHDAAQPCRRRSRRWCGNSGSGAARQARGGRRNRGLASLSRHPALC